MSELEEFRKEKDQLFKDDPQSPLTSEQRKTFSGLAYFPGNPALRLEVVAEVFPVQSEIEMQTTTGEIQAYQRFGRIHFTVEKQEVALTIYYSDTGYFLPFVDSLAGKETYPAGRYLEPEALGKGRFLVDFNLAYNPYCAYGEHWSCPITPFENRIKAPVRAGEMIYAPEHVQ